MPAGNAESKHGVTVQRWNDMPLSCHDSMNFESGKQRGGMQRRPLSENVLPLPCNVMSTSSPGSNTAPHATTSVVGKCFAVTV